MTEERNPYAAPQAKTVAVAAGAAAADATRLRAEPLQLPAAAGSAWVGAAWELFKREPGILILLMVVYFLVSMAAQIVPVIGPLFMSLTGQVWIAGFMIAADKLTREEAIGVGDLFAGFSHPRLGSLILLSLVGILFVMLAVLAIAVPVLFTLGSTIFSGGTPDPETLLSHVTLIGVLAVVFTFVLALFLVIGLMFYAPLLILMHEVGVFAACGLSLKAVMRNWAPLTIYGLIMMALFIASVFTLFLGLLVLIPMGWLVMYLSYRGIFVEVRAEA